MVYTKDKKQILFLHGYLSSSKSFAYQIPFFEKDFCVFAPDLKGFGENSQMDYPFSLDDYVKDLLAYMKDNGIYKPHVIAHSFGARMVLKACASQEESPFDKIVLTGGAGLKPKNTIKKMAKKCVFSVAKRFISKEKLYKFYSPDYLSLNGVMKQSFIKIISEHLDYTLPYIKNETLLIYGKQDKETPLYMAKRLKSGIKNSRLSIYGDAGHFCFIDMPLTFNMEVREFLLS